MGAKKRQKRDDELPISVNRLLVFHFYLRIFTINFDQKGRLANLFAELRNSNDLRPVRRSAAAVNPDAFIASKPGGGAVQPTGR
jgi:hypothetical protein